MRCSPRKSFLVTNSKPVISLCRLNISVLSPLSFRRCALGIVILYQYVSSNSLTKFPLQVYEYLITLEEEVRVRLRHILCLYFGIYLQGISYNSKLPDPFHVARPHVDRKGLIFREPILPLRHHDYVLLCRYVPCVFTLAELQLTGSSPSIGEIFGYGPRRESNSHFWLINRKLTL